jgi:predicted PurR-regulated permease PerM
MRTQPKNPGSYKWLSAILALGALALGVGTLYGAREVLIPIALAILIALILAPIVTLLRRVGIGHTVSVILTVVFAFLIIGGMGTLVVTEVGKFANDLPTYQQNIQKRVADLKGAIKSGSVKRIQNTVEEVMKEVEKGETPPATGGGAVPVVVKEGSRFYLSMLTPLFRPAATSALVAALVIFMLLRRENLRDRLLRVAGYGQLAMTTKAIDEAGRQVSRFLCCQFLVNSGYGISVGVGLGLIGLPYALLWGFLAGLARFIPYAGPVIGATPPLLMSLAVFSHWTALMVLGLFLIVELVTAFLVEPVVYGKEIGISEVALLIMMAFWTWLWGPLGLVLSAPMTVCLMVISKSVPNLGFISLMLSREPAMETHRVLYHRLIARDELEARDILEKFLAAHSRSALFDQVLIPALISCRRDFRQHRLTEDDRRFVLEFIGRAIESPAEPATKEPAGDRAWLLACPATDEADELALRMLAERMHREQWRLRVLSFEMLSAETILATEKAGPLVLCIGFLPEAPFPPARQLCKRLRQRFPDLPIILAHWQSPEPEKARQHFAGLIDEFGWSMAETKNQLIQYAQMETPSGHHPNGTDAEPDTWIDHQAVLVPEKTQT